MKTLTITITAEVASEDLSVEAGAVDAIKTLATDAAGAIGEPDVVKLTGATLVVSPRSGSHEASTTYQLAPSE